MMCHVVVVLCIVCCVSCYAQCMLYCVFWVDGPQCCALFGLFVPVFASCPLVQMREARPMLFFSRAVNKVSVKVCSYSSGTTVV